MARKLALRPGEIVEFLSQNNISIDEGTNTRLEDNHVALIIAQLAPDFKEEISLEDEVVPETIEEVEPVKMEVEIAPDVESQEKKEEETIEMIESPTVEVIKAPKVELAGLKVLGKIELPEKKKPAAPPVEPTTPESNAPKAAERPRRPAAQKNDRERRDARPRKNPIAIQREREEQEEQERRRAQAKLDKERKTEYYLRRVKTSVPTKAVRLIEEPVEQLSASELREPPKTLLGRFWRWFTT